MRILLIEDHPIVRTACRQILQAHRNVEIIEATSAAAGRDIAGSFSPDLVILDLRLPDGNGLNLITALISAHPGQRIIVFSMHEDPIIAARALEAGARGYVTKNDDPDLLLRAIEKVSGGDVFLTPGMAEKIALMTMGLNNDPLQSLSSRERQVLSLLGQGQTLSEIADHLNFSYRTAAYAVAQIKAKLQISSTAAVIRWAVDHMPSATETR